MPAAIEELSRRVATLEGRPDVSQRVQSVETRQAAIDARQAAIDARHDEYSGSARQDQRDQWDAINEIRRQIVDIQTEVRLTADRTAGILAMLSEMREERKAADRDRAREEQTNAKAIADLKTKIEAMEAVKTNNRWLGGFAIAAVTSLLTGFAIWLLNRWGVPVPPKP